MLIKKDCDINIISICFLRQGLISPKWLQTHYVAMTFWFPCFYLLSEYYFYHHLLLRTWCTEGSNGYSRSESWLSRKTCFNSGRMTARLCPARCDQYKIHIKRHCSCYYTHGWLFYFKFIWFCKFILFFSNCVFYLPLLK